MPATDPAGNVATPQFVRGRGKSGARPVAYRAGPTAAAEVARKRPV